MNKRRLLFLGLTIFWCYMIYSFSHFTGESSGRISLKMAQWILSIISPHYESSSQVLDVLHFLIRKGAHMAEYAILYLFSYLFFSTFSFRSINIYLYPLIFSVGYAFLDEVHQLFVLDRVGRMMDVCIDTSGFLVMMGLIVIVKKCVSCKKTML